MRRPASCHDGAPRPAGPGTPRSIILLPLSGDVKQLVQREPGGDCGLWLSAARCGRVPERGVVSRIDGSGLRAEDPVHMATTLMIVDDHKSFRDAARRVL